MSWYIDQYFNKVQTAIEVVEKLPGATPALQASLKAALELFDDLDGHIVHISSQGHVQVDGQPPHQASYKLDIRHVPVF